MKAMMFTVFSKEVENKTLRKNSYKFKVPGTDAGADDFQIKLNHIPKILIRKSHANMLIVVPGIFL
jgi:hypothetical protein